MLDVRNPIKLVAQRTGLSPHLIRMWEKRYQAVCPNRTETHRRLYSDEEIERLRLLRMATEAGHRIGDIARLETDQLRDLAASGIGVADPSGRVPAPTWGAPDAVAEALTAVKHLDGRTFDAVLDRAAVTFGTHGILQHVIAPIAHAVGEAWAQGSVTAAHEHFVSDRARNFLHRHARAYAESESMPVLVVATPAGQLHELGAALAAAAARDTGWRVVYLGANLPAAEIAGAVQQSRARVLALSLVYPGDDPGLPEELRYLRRLLPAEVRILIGGRATREYQNAVSEIGAVALPDLDGLYTTLESLRSTSHRS